MSSPRHIKLAGTAMATLLLSACATTQSDTVPVETAAPEETAELLTPASPQERTVADRLPALERANFWAREHAKTPGDLDTALRFSAALRGIGSHRRAGDVLQMIEPEHPENGELKLQLARARMAENKFAEARRILLDTLEVMPDSAAALAVYGLANDKLGDHASAQTAYRQALELEPDRASTLSNLGFSLTLTGDLDGAETVLRRAVLLNGRSTNIRQNLALVLGLQGRYDEMLEVAGDAPEEIMQRNAELLRALRGDGTAEEPIAQMRRHSSES